MGSPMGSLHIQASLDRGIRYTQLTGYEHSRTSGSIQSSISEGRTYRNQPEMPTSLVDALVLVYCVAANR